MKILVVYWSSTGNTEVMAKAVAEGAKEAGAEVSLFSVSEVGAITDYDALLFGCPSMGAEELEPDEFEPFFSAIESSLAGKKVGLFGSYGWGDGEWMRTWQDRVIGVGATLIADGVIANEAPDNEAINKCKELGKLSAK